MRGTLLLCCALAACGGPHARHDQPDASGGGHVDAPSGGGGDAQTEQVYVYAHSASTLYRVDPDSLAIQQIGDFGWPASVGTDQMTDLAIDKTGRMIGVSFTSVYQVDPSTAKATLLSSSLEQSFNGLSFVPAAQLGRSGDDVLVGTRNADGKVYEVNPTTGAATQIGDMAGGFSSSGDLVAIAGFGTVQTVPGNGNDRLVRLAPGSFTATAIGSDTGFGQIWGLAFWKGKVYGFTNGGAFVLIDAQTGAGTLVASNGVAWWGAAVTTLAPVIP